MTATQRQPRSAEAIPQTTLRMPPELLRWFRIYAASQEPPITQGLALRRALEEFKARHS